MILAIEASTSSAKALLYSRGNGVIREKSVVYEPDAADVLTMDFNKVYEKLMDVVMDVVGADRLTVTDIAISTIWNSLVFLNEDLQAITRVMTWADTSGSEAWLENQESDWSQTGCPKHYKFTRWKLGKLEFERHLTNRDKIGSLADMIFLGMTGEWCISKMSASGSGLLNLESGDWHDDALDSLGLSKQQLPLLVDWRYQTTIGKEAAERLCLGEGVKVHIPNGDGGLNQYAEGGYDTSIMSMSIGTSAAIRRMTQRPMTGETESLWVHYIEEGYWVAGATFSGAGNLINWFMKEVNTEALSFQILEERMRQLEIEQLPIFLPFMYGEQSPGWRNKRTYGYCEDVSGYKIEALYYALLEGILFSLKQGYTRLVQVYGVPAQIQLSGGILNAPYWLELAASVLEQPLSISDNQHSSLAGAVRLVSGDKLTATKDRILPDQRMMDKLSIRYNRYLEFYKRDD